MEYVVQQNALANGVKFTLIFNFISSTCIHKCPRCVPHLLCIHILPSSAQQGWLFLSNIILLQTASNLLSHSTLYPPHRASNHNIFSEGSYGYPCCTQSEIRKSESFPTRASGTLWCDCLIELRIPRISEVIFSHLYEIYTKNKLRGSAYTSEQPKKWKIDSTWNFYYQ